MKGTLKFVIKVTESRPAVVGMLLALITLNPFLVTRVRHAIRQVTLNQTQSVAKDVLDATTSTEIKAILAAMLREIFH